MLARMIGGAVLALTLATSVLSAHDEFRVVGSIVSMDLRARALTVKMIPQPGDDADVVERNVRIVLASYVTTERDGKPITLADLKPGLYVVVDATGHDYTDLEAVKVRIVPPPPGR
jgi:hypothetical protein